MITTGCESCCFLSEDGTNKGCLLRQACVLKDGHVVAPGYCRQCRSHQWAAKQNEKKIPKLLHKVIEENELKMDLLVFFDEAVNNIEHLERTLGTDWYVKYTKSVIIIDTTGFGKQRQNLALQYIKSKEHPVPTVVDSSVLNESITQREATIRRISAKVIAPFFMTIPAGSVVNNIFLMSKTVQYMPSRVIHWSLPIMIGGTVISPINTHHGLFITEPYRALTRSPEAESFSKQLISEEAEAEMRLSWLCSECGLV